jgi:hypothetical protein
VLHVLIATEPPSHGPKNTQVRSRTLRLGSAGAYHDADASDRTRFSDMFFLPWRSHESLRKMRREGEKYKTRVYFPPLTLISPPFANYKTRAIRQEFTSHHRVWQRPSFLHSFRHQRPFVSVPTSMTSPPTRAPNRSSTPCPGPLSSPYLSLRSEFFFYPVDRIGERFSVQLPSAGKAVEASAQSLAATI